MNELIIRMNETSFDHEPKPETTVNDEPQFGLLDVVEAFTAMRHEWRTQSKQNRDLAQSMQASTELLTRLDIACSKPVKQPKKRFPNQRPLKLPKSSSSRKMASR